MVQSFEAVIEPDGSVQIDSVIRLEKPHKAIVTILDEPAIEEVTKLSEKALAEDWLRPEEEEAWAH